MEVYNGQVCELCLCKEATKTGSHILPHSLTREALNFEGSKQRDKELTFTFSTSQTTRVFVGQSVLPEKIDELEINVDSLEQASENLSTENFILCPTCESRLSIIEGYFSDKVINHLSKSEDIFKDKGDTFNIKNLESNLVRLYVYSLYWRAAISKKNKSFELPDNEKEMLRQILDRCLDLSIDTIRTNTSLMEPLISSMPIRVFYSEAKEDPTSNFVYMDSSIKRPYILFANRFVFNLFFKESHTRGLENNMFGLSKFFKQRYAINQNEKEICFIKVTLDKWKEICNNVFTFMAHLRLHNEASTFSRLYSKSEHFGRAPHPFVVDLFKALIGQHGTNITNEIRSEVARVAIQEGVKRGLVQTPKTS